MCVCVCVCVCALNLFVLCPHLCSLCSVSSCCSLCSSSSGVFSALPSLAFFYVLCPFWFSPTMTVYDNGISRNGMNKVLCIVYSVLFLLSCSVKYCVFCILWLSLHVFSKVLYFLYSVFCLLPCPPPPHAVGYCGRRN